MMTQKIEIAETRVNPYVGPRAFGLEEVAWFKGRDREGGELLSLLLARRLVLFYAQSGAGKTSLLNASLIPSLKAPEVDFEVLPIGRVGDALIPPEGVKNIFVYNLIVSLGVSRHPERLASLSLSDFLLDLIFDGRNFTHAGEMEVMETAGAGEETVVAVKPRALIIDQFEEIFTVHPEFERERIEFFQQVSEALEEDPYLYVMFSMRGDYYDRLTPYVHLLPDSLRTRFYMERMREAEALDAVRQPAAQQGRPFTENVSQKLVRYLRRLKTSDGRTAAGEDNLDPYVETVQLQVVCRQLWQSLENTPGNTITMEDVERVAQNYAEHTTVPGQNGGGLADPLATFIDTALAGYYEQAIEAVHNHSELSVPEHELRRWFSKELITASGTRNLLARGEEETRGIPEKVISLLDTEHHLVRNDMRGGRPFIELVHDSFIEPILKANSDWETRRTKEIPWLNAALRYHETKDRNLLLSSDNLLLAQRQSNGVNGLPVEAIDYLNDSLAEQEKRQEEARLVEEKRLMELAHQREMAEAERKRAEAAEKARLRQRTLTVFALVAAVIATVLGFWATGQSRVADEERQKALQSATEARNAEAVAEQFQAAAETSEAAALTAQATAEAAREEALENLEQAKVAQNEAESLRLADKAESFYEENNITAALLLGRLALTFSPTEKAQEVFSETLSVAVTTSSNLSPEWREDISIWPELACELAGRNLTAGEWQAKFPKEQLNDDYVMTCEAYRLHLSFAERSLRHCTASALADANEYYTQARPATDGDGRSLAFEEWKTHILLNETTVSAKRACLELVGMDDQEAESFLSIVNGVKAFDGLGLSGDEAFQRVKDLDSRRENLPSFAAAELDQSLAGIYKGLCVNLTLSIEAAQEACETHEALAGGVNIVSIFPVRDESDKRTFSFPGNAGFVARIEMTNDATSALFGPNGGGPLYGFEVSQPDTTIAANVFLLTEAGEYELEVSWSSEPPPMFLLSVELSEPAVLDFDQQTPRTTADIQWWRFEGSAGEIVKITKNALDDGASYFQVFDEEGNYIVQSFEAAVETILPGDDTYFLNIGGINDQAGQYTLSLSKVAGEIEYGESLEGSAGRRYWRLRGNAGDVVSIGMNAVNDGDPVLILLNDQLEPIASNDNGPTGLDALLNAVLPGDGIYYLDAGWYSEAGRYSLSLNRVEPLVIKSGETLSGASDMQNWWQLADWEGGGVLITMETEGNGEPYLRLFDADNVEISSSYGSGDNQTVIIQQLLAGNDTYYLEAGWFSGSGTYSLSVDQIAAGSLEIGETVTGTSDEEWWRVEGKQGELVEFVLHAEVPDSSPQLYIYYADGRQPNYDYVDDTQDASLKILFLEEGVYYLWIRWTTASPYQLAMNPGNLENDPDAGYTLLAGSLELIRTGGVEAGLELLNQAQSLDGELAVFGYDYNYICWFGSLWGYAAEVLFACEAAVALEPENGEFLDSRGVARAMTGDFDGAIEDFQFYIDWVGFVDEIVEMRREWIEALEAGINPFDEALREQLRDQSV